MPDPGFPPFYSKEFFAIIRGVYRNNPTKVATMTEKEWYTKLLEDHCIMELHDDEPPRYTPCNAELRSPTTNWEIS